MQTTTSSPSKAVILRPVDDLDPRLTLDDQALALASRNAFPVVARAKSRSDGMGMAAGVGAALLLGGITFWGMSGHRTAPQQQPAAVPMVAPPQPVAPPPAPAPAPAVSIPPQAITPVPAPAPLASSPALDPAQRLQAPAMVFDTSAPAGAPMVKSDAPPASKSAAAAPAGGGENEQFAARIGGESGDVVSATAMANPSTTVSQGTLIPAVLETAIDTDLPGYVRAVVSRDIRAFDGKTVLIPRSSRLIGQYKSGLQAGQQRAYVIWSRLIRPDGASIALGSPAVDFAGRAGLGGKVDGHFLQRFGSAMLLSVVGGLGAIGSGGTSVVLATGGQSAASVAAGRDASIPPTVRVRQGEPIRIFTARDLDFSTVGEWVKG